jgi:hypothetical protein
MKSRLMILSLLGLLLGTAGAWARAADISGTWEGSVDFEAIHKGQTLTFTRLQQPRWNHRRRCDGPARRSVGEDSNRSARTIEAVINRGALAAASCREHSTCGKQRT